MFKSKKPKKFTFKPEVSRKKIFYKKRQTRRNSRFSHTGPRLIKEDNNSVIRKVILVLFIVLFFIAGYFVFFTDIIKVKNVAVSDVTTENEQYIQKLNIPEIERSSLEILNKKFLYIIPLNNYLLFNQSSFTSDLLDRHHEIEEIEIKKRFPNLLTITATSKQPALIWKSSERYYLLDQNGYSYMEVSLENQPLLPVVNDLSNKEVILNQEITFPKHINYINDLYSHFNSSVNFNIDYFELPSTKGNEIHVVTTDSWKVYFNIERSPESSISDLKTVIEKDIKEKIDHLKYIDLRIENWVYYK